jgi:inorganic pyrophosphatase
MDQTTACLPRAASPAGRDQRSNPPRRGIKSYYSDVAERQDLPSIIFQQIEHFFTHYKDLEAEKWVRVGQWGDAAEARRIVAEAIERAKTAT